MRFLPALLLLICVGCHPMPKGDLAEARHADVILLRGWRDLYSDGINQLATRLKAEHYRTAVFGESQWKDVAEVIAARGSASLPVVLVGFSYGADHAVDIARRLESEHVRVLLLITLDPVTPPKVPANVAICQNLYQSNGVWDLFPWFRGIPLKPESAGTPVINRDVHDWPDLDSPNMAHKTIAGSEAIHREVIAIIRKYAARDRM